MAPVLRQIAEDPRIDLEVAHCCMRGVHTTCYPEFATAVQWDIPLLGGNKWVEIPNLSAGGIVSRTLSSRPLEAHPPESL
jgi:hypothetical protein